MSTDKHRTAPPGCVYCREMVEAGLDPLGELSPASVVRINDTPSGRLLKRAIAISEETGCTIGAALDQARQDARRFELGDSVEPVDAEPGVARCEVVAINEDGTYDVEDEDGETIPSVSLGELRHA